MAKKAAVTSKEEQAAVANVAAIQKAIGDKTPTDKQKADLKAAKETLAGLKFIRIANKRIPKALKAITQIGALSGAGYMSTDSQRSAIKQALEQAVSDAMQKLSGQKQAAPGFQLK